MPQKRKALPPPPKGNRHWRNKKIEKALTNFSRICTNEKGHIRILNERIWWVQRTRKETVSRSHKIKVKDSDSEEGGGGRRRGRRRRLLPILPFHYAKRRENKKKNAMPYSDDDGQVKRRANSHIRLYEMKKRKKKTNSRKGPVKWERNHPLPLLFLAIGGDSDLGTFSPWHRWDEDERRRCQIKVPIEGLGFF